MGRFIDRFLSTEVNGVARALVLVAALLLLPAYFAPLWRLTMFAPQYPDGLYLDIYSYKLEGGNKGQDLKEINVLNHYIGMKDLAAEDFTEFKWMPFVIGGLILLFLRAGVFAHGAQLLDCTALYVYFALFSLWSFAYKLYSYGHSLTPGAPVTVDPFMPPLFGHEQLANFEVYSYPSLASYALGAAGLAMGVAMFLTLRSVRRSRTQPAPAALAPAAA